MYRTRTRAQISINSASLSALKVAGAVEVVGWEGEEGKGSAQRLTVLKELNKSCNEKDSHNGLVRASNPSKKFHSQLQERTVRLDSMCRAITLLVPPIK